jgi:hypothetical protein
LSALLWRVKVTNAVAFVAEIPGSIVEDSLLSALEFKIAALPQAEFAPKPSPIPDAQDTASREGAEDHSCGGCLRGLFWALLLEGAAIVVAASALVAWRLLR